jgi:hypothetical protein
MREQVEYLHVMKQSLACDISNASFEQAQMKALTAIMEKIGKVDVVPTPEATECFGLLLDSHFLQSQRGEITEGVESIRSGLGKKHKKTGHHFTQSCPALHNLLTDALWAKIGSLDDLQLVEVIGGHMQNLGLVFANEPTYCSIGCSVALARMLKTDQKQHYDINRIYAFTEELKGFIRLDREKLRLPHYGLIQVYSNDPGSLKARWPEIYQRAFAEGDPVKSMIDQHLLDQLCDAVPCRTSHRALNMHSKRMIQSCIMNVGDAPQPPAEAQIPGLRILGRGGGVAPSMMYGATPAGRLPALANADHGRPVPQPSL